MVQIMTQFRLYKHIWRQTERLTRGHPEKETSSLFCFLFYFNYESCTKNGKFVVIYAFLSRTGNKQTFSFRRDEIVVFFIINHTHLFWMKKKKKNSDNKNSHNSPTKLVAKIEVYLVANALELGGGV